MQEWYIQHPAPALVASLVRGHADGRLEERLASYAKPKLLIVDELGYLHAERGASLLPLTTGVSPSLREGRGSMLITSNRTLGE